MAAPSNEQKVEETQTNIEDTGDDSKNDESTKFTPITVKEVHDLGLEFEKCHKKDNASLKTLHAAQGYLKRYWLFYEQNGRNPDAMNQTIKNSVSENKYSTAYLMHHLAVNSREVLLKNKINLPFGNGMKPSEQELRALLPKNTSKVVAPNTPPSVFGGNKQILTMFHAAHSLKNNKEVK